MPASRPGARTSTSPSIGTGGGLTAARRRQRSVRVTVAVALLGVATVLVLLGLLTRSVPWLGAGAVVALGLSWAALRMMWTEVLQSRREHAADRAATAAAYRDLVGVRTAEHAEFTATMTRRLAQSHSRVRTLERALEQATEQAREQAAGHARAARQAAEAEALAAYQAGSDDSVVELVAWDEQQSRVAQPSTRQRRRGA